ncbi:MAG: hypothetical protein QM503_12130, partial [Bacteroidota bacterium]
MKNIYRLIILISIISVVAVQHTQAQYVTKKIKSKHQIYTDSLKNVEYNYVFPILGQGAYKKGFDIPYPIGVMVNYIWMDQGIDITNMQLGLKTDDKDIPLTPVDFIDFGETRNTSYAFNIRPDVWVFPFLNVYGLFGYGESRTEVNLVAPVALKSVVEQSITTAGVGVMTAFGIGPVWLSVDANWTWNKPELLDKAVLVNVLGLRLGHTFTFKQRPDRNIAIWAGGMRLNMSSDTRGAVAMKDALPPETWDRRDEIVDQYNTWYNGLPPAKQALVDETAVPDIVDKLAEADGDAVIRYGMDKQVLEMWNGVIGAQFQLNKSWQFR